MFNILYLNFLGKLSCNSFNSFKNNFSVFFCMESLNSNMAANSGPGFSIFSQQIKSICACVCMQCKPCVLRNGGSAEWRNGCIILPGLWASLSALCNLIHQHCLQGLAQPLTHSVLYSSQDIGGDSKIRFYNSEELILKLNIFDILHLV
jgi:hypothetical protein